MKIFEVGKVYKYVGDKYYMYIKCHKHLGSTDMIASRIFFYDGDYEYSDANMNMDHVLYYEQHEFDRSGGGWEWEPADIDYFEILGIK